MPISKVMNMDAVASTSVTIQSLERNGQVLRDSTFRHQVNGLPMRVAKAQAGRKRKT